MDDSRTKQATAIGVFQTVEEAGRAVDELRGVGFAEDQIGFAWRDPSEREGDDNREGEPSDEAKRIEGLGIGAVVGGLVGAAVSLLVPGVGSVIVGGILATEAGSGVIAAATAAAATLGGFAGSLAGLGIPAEAAAYYQNQLAAGRAVVAVRSAERASEARSILRAYGGNLGSADGAGGLTEA